MLGAVGFISLSIIIGAFSSLTFRTLKPLYNWDRLLSFVSAFTILAAVAIVWAIAVLVGNKTAEFIFLTDVLLVIATGLMLDSLIDLRKQPVFLALVSLVGAFLLVLRSFYQSSTAYVSDGILHFNLSQTEIIIISLGFLLVWLPVGVRLFHTSLSRVAEFAHARQLMVFLYSGTILVTCYFLTAVRPAVIIVSFIAICILFAATTGYLYSVTKSKKSHKRSKK